jgi:Cu/Ag efflux protein CusF
MAGTSHDAGKAMAHASMPGTDQSAMGHGSTPSANQSGSGNWPGASAQVAQAGPVQGSGIVNSVDPSRRKINLSHNAIPAIGWPAMTMDFAVAPSVDLRQVKVGAHVNFMIQRGSDDMYVIQSITPTGGSH